MCRCEWKGEERIEMEGPTSAELSRTTSIHAKAKVERPPTPQRELIFVFYFSLSYKVHTRNTIFYIHILRYLEWLAKEPGHRPRRVGVRCLVTHLRDSETRTTVGSLTVWPWAAPCHALYHLFFFFSWLCIIIIKKIKLINKKKK